MTLPLRVVDDLSPVLANDLCIACGACVAADPSLELRLHPQKKMYEPTGPGNATAAAVCPAVQVDFVALQNRLFPDASRTGPLGAIESIYLAQSLDRERNVKASSGGLIKELLLAYLADPNVNGAIVLAHSGGLLFEPKLITKAEEVDQLPGSIYHNIPFDKALKLLSETPGRYVLVAIPCQLEGIFNYIYKVRPELRERIYATIGLICGWTYTHHAIEAICDYKGSDASTIKDISFRGGGPVGRLRIAHADGVETTVHRRVDFSYQVAFDRAFNTPRCHFCVNHTNFLADVVVGDAWLPSTLMTKTGISLVICRSKGAAAMLRGLVDGKRIRVVEASDDDIVESQTRRVAYGDFSYAYIEWTKRQGGYAPDLNGPNRAAAKLWPDESVAKFHSETTRKIALQRQGRYRFLWWRKLTRESGRLSWRYIRWFFVRVLKVKSLFGVRKELKSDALADFA